MSEDEVLALAAQWFRFASEDLETACRVMKDGYPPRFACWAAQQAAEKALKALLLQRRIDFPKTHSLRLLNDLLMNTERLGCETAELNDLSDWAVQSRYPGPWPEATREQAERATEMAVAIVRHVQTLLA